MTPAERNAMTLALAVLSGTDMNKASLTRALEACQAVLKSPVYEGPCVGPADRNVKCGACGAKRGESCRALDAHIAELMLYATKGMTAECKADIRRCGKAAWLDGYAAGLAAKKVG